MSKLIKNFSYTIVSNLLTFIVVTLITLIVPKLIGISDYGYWQLYLFYTTYVGIFHLGWLDGIYLRYGGIDYGNLEKNVFFSQLCYFSIFQIIIVLVIYGLSFIFLSGDNRFTVLMTANYLILSNIRQFFLYILQDSYRIKKYALILIIDRIIFIIIIIPALILKIDSFKILIIADLIAKLLTLLLSFYACKEILRGHLISAKKVLAETIKNIDVGIKLLFANFSGTLVVGIVRWGIKEHWGVAVFGKVSLTLSISNALMLFINAVSLVLFPVLKRIKDDKLTDVYQYLRNVLMLGLFACLLVYFPMIILLNKWLPQYDDSLKYLSFLFPILVYEGKFEILVNTFMKVKRQEKKLVLTNTLALLFSFVLTVINIMLVKKLTLIMVSIIIILLFRSNLGEVFISKDLKIKHFVKNFIIETMIVLIFILSTWFTETGIAIFVYGCAFFVYVLLNIKSIIMSLRKMKSLL